MGFKRPIPSDVLSTSSTVGSEDTGIMAPLAERDSLAFDSFSRRGATTSKPLDRKSKTCLERETLQPYKCKTPLSFVSLKHERDCGEGQRKKRRNKSDDMCEASFPSIPSSPRHSLVAYRRVSGCASASVSGACPPFPAATRLLGTQHGAGMRTKTNPGCGVLTARSS